MTTKDIEVSSFSRFTITL